MNSAPKAPGEPAGPDAAPRIALIAGESSGDQLGAGLAVALRERFPDARFAGIAGPAMQEAGVEAWHQAEELAVMGLAEVLRHLPRLLRLRRRLVRRLLDWKPDLVVGIDAPDFNLGLEKRLKRAGVRTAHYVSPSVWAWREKRAARIGESADQVLCLFPMEPPIYASHGVDARFVGHPLADLLPLQPDRAGARAALGVSPDRRVLALLPGSRLGEIRRLADDFFGTAEQLVAEFDDLTVLVPAATPACRAAIEAALAQRGLALDVRVFDGRAREILVAADVALVASGTATLETLLAKCPMVVGYRVAPLTYALVSGLKLMRTDRYSLPNALAGERLVPECMQHECTPERLAAPLRQWLRDPESAAGFTPRFADIHRSLRRDASRQAAAALAELL